MPAGYAFEGAGRNYSPVYPDGTKESDSVYRWIADTVYIRDGQQILENARQGVYRVAPEHAAVAEMVGGMAMEALQFGLSNISVEPESEDADRAREIIDDYRANGLV